MENSDARAVRRVRCPRCHSVLEEPSGVAVYQCGGCGTSLRAKIRTSGTGDVASVSSSSRSGPPPQSRHLNSSDVVAPHRGLPSLRGARAQYPHAQPKHPAAKEAKRLLPTRSNYQPVLKGAPFIVCSNCFRLVQVPADFAVSTNDTVCKLRCGSCSHVLSYSYRDPARKKRYQDFIDQLNTDTSESHVEVALLFEDPDEPGSPGYQVGGCSTSLRDDNQVEQIPPEGTEKGLGRNIAPSWWEDVLQLPISSGLPIPSIYQVGTNY